MCCSCVKVNSSDSLSMQFERFGTKLASSEFVTVCFIKILTVLDTFCDNLIICILFNHVVQL